MDLGVSVWFGIEHLICQGFMHEFLWLLLLPGADVYANMELA
jgi:hypothetical protein